MKLVKKYRILKFVLWLFVFISIISTLNILIDLLRTNDIPLNLFIILLITIVILPIGVVLWISHLLDKEARKMGSPNQQDNENFGFWDMMKNWSRFVLIGISLILIFFFIIYFINLFSK